MNRRDFLIGSGLTLAGILGLCSLPLEPIAIHLNKNKKYQIPAEEYASRARVILTFDGSYNLLKWQKTIDLGNKLSDIMHAPVHFTYFINTAYYSLKREKRSDIGWAKSTDNIDKRIALTAQAITLGHEIGSHTVHHRNGQKWSYSQWVDEIAEFDQDVARMFKDGKKPYKSVGFRAPYLAWNQNLFLALQNAGYLYDSSMPENLANQNTVLPEIAIPRYIQNNGKKILGMDYNWDTEVKLKDTELESILERQLRQDGQLIIALHFGDFTHGKRSYYQVVSDFLLKHAKAGDIKITTMKDYAIDITTPAQ